MLEFFSRGGRAPGRPVLAYTDGTPFFWLADTWWRAPSEHMHLADFTTAAQQRKEQGYTVIQMHGSAGFWPVAGGVNCTQAVELLNVSFFQREDAYYETAEVIHTPWTSS